MKRIILIAMALALMLTAAAAAETTITVSGESSILLPADTAVITLGVNTQAGDALTAQSDANAAIAGIRAALVEAGIPEDDINTNYITINPSYDYMGEESDSSYSASSSLAIRTNDMDMVGTIIDLALDAGANTLSGISYSASDTEEVRAEALAAASDDARRQAETIAAANGLKITEIESISQVYSYCYESDANNFAAHKEIANEGASTVVQAARLEMHSSVTITFEAEDNRHR